MCFHWSHLKCMQPHCNFQSYKQEISAVNDSLEKSWELYKQNVLTHFLYNKMHKWCFLFILTRWFASPEIYKGIHKLALWACKGGSVQTFLGAFFLSFPPPPDCPHTFKKLLHIHTYILPSLWMWGSMLLLFFLSQRICAIVPMYPFFSLIFWHVVPLIILK